MEPLHEHNQRTYANICRMYDEGIQRVAVVQPTGSGKSLLMAKLIEDNSDSRFFVLSTSHKINDQFKEKLDEEMLERINFNIYCNMPNIKKEDMEILQPDYILLDEMHRALAKEWSKGINILLEMYPEAKVLGLSATPIRYLDRCRNVVEELFNGNLACDMSLSQAILDGILPMARYVCGVYSYEKDTQSLNKRIEKSYNSEEEKKELLQQVKILKENLDKGHGVSDIFRKYIISGNEKFVVFLKDTKHLRRMKPVIEKWFTDAGFSSVRLYEVHCKNVDRDKEFQAFKDDVGDGIKLCLSVNMVAEGIHGDINGVIMLRETMSPNFYFQMIGRAFSCRKKTIPLIFDLVANSQFISDSVDNFPNELKGEIEKRKKECEKENKDYEVGFDIDEFIVMDQFMDVISGFRAIEERLEGSWDLYIKALTQFKEREGDCDVPGDHVEVVDGRRVKLGKWCSMMRDAKNRAGSYKLTNEMEAELNEAGFVWDVFKYRFENKVKAVADYYEKFGKYSYENSNDIEIKGLWMFIESEKSKMRNDNIIYPEWKKEIINKYLPDFSCETRSEKLFNEFIYYVKLYRKKYNHVDIKARDVIEGYNIGCNFLNWKKKYINNELSDDRARQFEDLHIDLQNRKEKLFFDKMQLAKQAVANGISVSRSNPFYENVNLYTWATNTARKKHEKNELTEDEIKTIERVVKFKLDSKTLKRERINLCKQAINEGVILKSSNGKYRGVNLYNWIENNKRLKNFSREELNIVNKLINTNNYIAVEVIDLTNNNVVGKFLSIESTVRAMREKYDIKINSDTIRNHLTGKRTTPYMGRFMFYYADEN